MFILMCWESVKVLCRYLTVSVPYRNDWEDATVAAYRYHHGKKTCKKPYSSVFMSLFFLMCLSIEVFALRDKETTRRFSYVLFTLPLAFFLLDSVKQIVFNLRTDTRMIYKASMNDYLLHSSIIFPFQSFGIESSIVLFVLGTLITIVLVLTITFRKF